MSMRTAWGQMMARCYDPENHKYASYGGRGIRVCDRWLCCRLFIEDMGQRPQGMTLNRIDNDGPYSPENCEWADAHTQSRNRQDTRLITFNGETLCLTDWARKAGMRFETLRTRIDLGWSFEDAITKPIGSKQCKM